MANTVPSSTSSNKIDCIQQWESDLRKTNNALNKAWAMRNRSEKKYRNAVSWENKLKVYWRNVVKTEELSKVIEEELGVFNKRLDTVCVNLECINEVLDIVFCLLRDFYGYTDALKLKLTSLKREIDCLNEPELNPKNSILVGCIYELCANLDVAIASQKEVMKKIIEVLIIANELYEMVCGDTCSLRRLINVLINLFDGMYPVKQAEPVCPGHEPSCNAMIAPKPAMPLREDVYYTVTQHQFETSTIERETAKSEYDTARGEHNELLSIKSSLTDALAAARAAKECK